MERDSTGLPGRPGGWIVNEEHQSCGTADRPRVAERMPGHVALSRYLEDGGHFPEAITVRTHARDVARRAGDRVAEASALSSPGLAAWWQGRYDQADNHLRQALAMFREAGDRPGEIGALVNLGMIEEQQGRYEQAASCYRQALTLSRQTRDQNSQAYALASLGAVERRQRRFESAASHVRQGLPLFRTAGNRAAHGTARRRPPGTPPRGPDRAETGTGARTRRPCRCAPCGRRPHPAGAARLGAPSPRSRGRPLIPQARTTRE
jgi:tetratricopeptide (TPR) repeat protein